MPPRKKTSKAAAFFNRLVDYKVEDLFQSKRPPPQPRTIYFNEELPSDAYFKGKPKPEWVYATNQVVTSKYSVFTFLPRNLLEQFRRLANAYVSSTNLSILI